MLDMVMAKVKAETANESEGMPFTPDQLVKVWGDMAAQVQNLSFTIQLGKTSLLIQEYVCVEPNTAMAKAMKAVPAGQKAGLDRLPNLPYVLACGLLPQAKMQTEQEMQDMVLKLVAAGMTKNANVPEATAKKITDQIAAISKTWTEQVTAVQFVVGGAPENTGAFGAAAVISCKESAKVRASLADCTDLATSLLAAMGEEEPDLAKLTVSYAKDAEKAGSASVDVIEFTHPSLAELGDEEKEGMKKVLGEDKIRILMSVPDEKTVVVAFGGGTAMLEEALKTAKGGGPIAKDAGVVEAMKVMPKQPTMVLVLDAAHLMDVARKAADALSAPIPPIALTGKTPIAIGGGVSDDMVHVVIYVPNDLVKDVVNTVKMFLTGMGGGAEPGPSRARPAPKGGESF